MNNKVKKYLILSLVVILIAVVFRIASLNVGAPVDTKLENTKVDLVKSSKVERHNERMSKKGNTAQEIQDEKQYVDLDHDVLLNYGKDEPLDDLLILYKAMDTYRVLVRSNPRKFPPATSNAILVNALTGANREKLRVLNPESDFISDTGEILDRWGKPLKFHFVSSQSIGIRSSGPDRVLYSTDDIVLPAKEAILFTE